MNQYNFFLIACFVLLAYSAGAKEFVVSVAGNDLHLGTRDQPFKSIFKASESAMPGDTITIQKGEYQLSRQFRQFVQVFQINGFFTVENRSKPLFLMETKSEKYFKKKTQCNSVARLPVCSRLKK